MIENAAAGIWVVLLEFIMKNDNVIVDKSRYFAVRIVKLYRYVKDKYSENIICKQLLRSGTSIGANVSEGDL